MSISVPKITNLTLTAANTEYTFTPGSFASKFMIQCRGLADMKMAFRSTESGTTYVTIFSGSSYNENGVFSGVRKVYLQSTQAGQIAEILEWT